MVAPPVSAALGLNRSIAESRALLSELQQQLATGKKVQTYSDLGIARNQVLSLRSELSQIGSYRDTIKQVDIRMDVMLQTLERVRNIASDTRSESFGTGFELNASGQTVFQTSVAARFDEAVGLLNTNVGDRHLFAGRNIESAPVAASTDILEGAGSQAGFKQIVSERRQADLGADGLGRLVLAGPQATVTGGVVATPGDIGGAATAQVTIDIGGNAQNFDISDGGFDTLAALESAIDAAFGADVATIVGGNQLQLTATNATDTITITDIDAGAAALAGLTTGVTTNPSASATLAEDVAGSPFGFKLSAATSVLTGTIVTGPAGAPASVNVQFSATLPNDGDTIRLSLDLPDGTTHEMILTARTSGPLSDGEFLIGVDENEAAANFQTLLTTSVQTEAQRSLSAASLFAASDNFFDFDATNPPQRVDGPPFDTAVALRNATTADTVFWYTGEVSSTSARGTALAKGDDTIIAAYGARANEDALRTVVKNAAAIAVETFSAGDANANERYGELKTRAASRLTFTGATQSPEDIITEIAVASTTLGQANERHKANEALLEGFIGEEENADIFEISAQLLALQGRVQASLQITASLSGLSLVNFL